MINSKRLWCCAFIDYYWELVEIFLWICIRYCSFYFSFLCVSIRKHSLHFGLHRTSSATFCFWRFFFIPINWLDWRLFEWFNRYVPKELFSSCLFGTVWFLIFALLCYGFKVFHNTIPLLCGIIRWTVHPWWRVFIRIQICWVELVTIKMVEA